MPFLPWTRWKSERSQQIGVLSQEVDRLAADSRVHRLFEWFTKHEREIAEFQLAITSVAAPPFAEGERAEWLGARLRELGLAVTSDAVGNVLALRPALQNDALAVGVSAHLDTVFPAATELDVRRENARLLGPGISDNGAGLSALWALAAAFHEVGIVTSTPLLFVGNVGEEGEGNLRGVRHLYREHLNGEQLSPEGLSREHLSPEQLSREQLPHEQLPLEHLERDHSEHEDLEHGAGVVADGKAPGLALLMALDGAGCGNVISQALGSRRFEVVISGPGGHSWSDYGTPNPIVAASLMVEMLFRIALPVNPRTTLNVGSIEGGTSINTIPERAVVKIDMRSSDPRRLDELEAQMRLAAANACTETEAHSAYSHGHLSHAIALVGERPAGELAANSPLLAAIRAVDGQLGIQTQMLRASTDANIPLSLGLQAVSLGAGGTGGGAHTVHEWYDPAGRELALKRLALLLLLLTGLAPVDEIRQPGGASAETAGAKESE